MNHTALLALENGSLFYGQSVGVSGRAIGEVVFNTATTGYQEVLTDPSYCQQMVLFTQPHIGNTGYNLDDEESSTVFASGLVIRDMSLIASSWRSNGSLADYLRQKNVVAIADVDTRQLTRIVRQEGALRGCIITDPIDSQTAIKIAQAAPSLSGMDLAKVVSTKETYQYQQGHELWHNSFEVPSSVEPDTHHVVVYDFGIKRNILRLLKAHGCRITVVPAQTSAASVLAEKPQGIFLSNGPGDPGACDYAIEAIAELMTMNIPIFGICLGYQLLSLSVGAKTMKMKFGHHGTNHPIQCLQSQKVMISSQNHSFAVEEESLPKCLYATHRSLFDGSLQGVHHRHLPAFGFQGHPEGSPGPHDLHSTFNHFIDLIKERC